MRASRWSSFHQLLSKHRMHRGPEHDLLQVRMGRLLHSQRQIIILREPDSIQSSPGTFVFLPSSTSSSMKSSSYSTSHGTYAFSEGKNHHLLSILEQVRDGKLSLSHAESLLIAPKQEQSYDNVPSMSNTARTTITSPDQQMRLLQNFATLDHSRASRTGFPEVVFGQGKTAMQIVTILDDMASVKKQQQVEDCNYDHDDTIITTSPTNNHNYYQNTAALLATRISPEMWNEIQTLPVRHGTLIYHEMARMVQLSLKTTASTKNTETIQNPSSNTTSTSTPTSNLMICVVTAGTTDLPVAEEAAVTLEAITAAATTTGTSECNNNIRVERITDCGAAGLHRILHALPTLQQADCIIVCAGMDGALPSVIGGLVPCPVIAVPTSIGYGAAFQGVAPLLTMLNSCSPGVAVMNIDNGFGAAAFAYKCCIRRGISS